MYGSFLCTIMGKKKQAQGHEAICPRSHSHEGAICCYSSTQISTEHLLSARQLPGEDRPNEAGVTGDKPICRAQQTSHRAKPCCSTECKVHALVILACTSPLSAPCPVPVTNNRKQHHSRAWQAPVAGLAPKDISSEPVLHLHPAGLGAPCQPHPQEASPSPGCATIPAPFTQPLLLSSSRPGMWTRITTPHFIDDKTHARGHVPLKASRPWTLTQRHLMSPDAKTPTPTPSPWLWLLFCFSLFDYKVAQILCNDSEHRGKYRNINVTHLPSQEYLVCHLSQALHAYRHIIKKRTILLLLCNLLFPIHMSFC